MSISFFMWFSLFVAISMGHAQQPEVSYWRDYLHQGDQERFDAEALRYGEMDPEEARASGSYTVVSTEDGKVTEAVTLLEGTPNYYYLYLHNQDGQLVERRMEAFVDGGTQLLSQVLYSYDNEGELLSSGYYTANPFDNRGPVLQYVKEYIGRNYRIHDYRQRVPDNGVRRELDEIGDQLRRQNELQSRGFLKRFLGID